MALIPLALALSNSSTVLSWLCVHVPHHVLVLLLLAGVILVVVLVVTGLLTLCCFAQKFLCVFKNWLTEKGICASPPKNPRAAVRLRTDTRHLSCPVQPLSMRCPHCFAEIVSPPSPIHVGPVKKPELALSSDSILLRRNSDASPLNRVPPPPPPFLPAPEPRITTPPRGESSPRKEPVRRSPRPPKPRKSDD